MAIDQRPGQGSSLINYLPAVFQEDGELDQPNFLGRFLLAFERILLGLGEISEEVKEPGLEEIIGGGEIVDKLDNPDNKEKTKLAGIQRYFEPGANLKDSQRVPSGDFLKWLASWVALTLREDWDESRQRDLIAHAAQLYRLRGTKLGVETALRIYQSGVQAKTGVEIDEQNTPFQLAVHSTVGKDTILDGGAPFFFWVHLVLPTANPDLIKQKREIARAIVDLQKPAYTNYDLTVKTPIFRINVNSTVGVDTLLG